MDLVQQTLGLSLVMWGSQKQTECSAQLLSPVPQVQSSLIPCDSQGQPQLSGALRARLAPAKQLGTITCDGDAQETGCILLIPSFSFILRHLHLWKLDYLQSHMLGIWHSMKYECDLKQLPWSEEYRKSIWWWLSSVRGRHLTEEGTWRSEMCPSVDFATDSLVLLCELWVSWISFVKARQFSGWWPRSFSVWSLWSKC